MKSSNATMLSNAPFGTLLERALLDLVSGVRMWELWSTLGWHDIRQRYRRSIVGPFWLTLSMAAMVGGLAFLYAGLFGQNVENYLPYVATGIIVFTLISTVATEGANVFISSAPHILQLKAPLSIYVLQMLWRNFLIFLHNITIYILILPFSNISLGWPVLLVLLGLFLVMLLGFWVGIAIGTLSARFRDIPPIIGSVMQVSFFLTPIFWLPGSLPNREFFVYLNPFYYLIDIVRLPLMGKIPGPSIWLVVVGLNIVAGLVAFIFFARYRARIAYWI